MRVDLAKNICRYRKEKGLTQEELAKKLGVTLQAVSKWETAQSLPDITFLPRLSQVFDISMISYWVMLLTIWCLTLHQTSITPRYIEQL